MSGSNPRVTAPVAVGTAGSPPPVGSLEWERVGGPPLSLRQKVAVLGGAAAVVMSHYAQMLRWRLGLGPRVAKVDLDAWRPPDTQAARAAHEACCDLSSPEMVNHSQRTYYFSAIMAQLGPHGRTVDREVLYVAAMMHDVGLFTQPRPPSDHCFTIDGARRARQIAAQSDWDDDRTDRAAMAITTNLNASVPAEPYGLEAHYMRAGGLVEVIAQEWKVHPDNLAEVLQRFPRDGFARDAVVHVEHEAKCNPSGRFACLDPLFPILVRRSTFDAESRPRARR